MFIRCVGVAIFKWKEVLMSTCLNPKTFGPHYWGAIHTAAANTEDFEGYVQFIDSITKILPCESCRENFKKNVEKHPVHENLFKWSVEIHNMVNFETQQSQMTYEQAYYKWCT